MNDMLTYLQRSWWIFLLRGLAAIAFGIMAFVWPALTLSVLVLLMFVAAWCIVGGLLRIALAFQIRREITGEWILIASGLLSVLIGGLLIVLPQAGLITLAWTIGFYALAFGALFILLAFHLRKLSSKIDTYA